MNLPDCFVSRTVSIGVHQVRGGQLQYCLRYLTTRHILQSDYDILAWTTAQMDRELLDAFGWVSADREWTVRMDVPFAA